MKVIARGARQGKTTELIKYAAEHFYYIAVSNRAQVQRITDMAREMGLDIPYPITHSEFILRQYQGRNIESVIIDDAEMLLQQMAVGVEVKAISITAATDTPTEQG